MRTRVGVGRPKATRSKHHTPTRFPGNGAVLPAEGQETRGEGSSRLLYPSPLLAPASDATTPLLFPAAPFSSPHRLLPARPFPPRSRLSPSLVIQGPLLPFCFSSSRPRVPCTLSLGKGAGELANTGRSQVEATGRGKRRGFSTPTG